MLDADRYRSLSLLVSGACRTRAGTCATGREAFRLLLDTLGCLVVGVDDLLMKHEATPVCFVTGCRSLVWRDGGKLLGCY